MKIISSSSKWIFSAALIAVGMSSCVEFKQLSLYDGEEVEPPAPKPEKISALVEPIIFMDDASDMWGLEEDACQKAELTKETVHSGEQAVKVTWNRDAEGCDFAGIGIGWDGWAGKDLSGVMDHAAIQFYVRTQEGKSFGLPIVLTLEDYSGGMGFAYTANKYFEKSKIDTVWQKIEVPLSSFDLDTENLDVTNVKQLQLELQQNGSFILDDFQLVFYTPVEVEPWMVEETLPDPIATPIQIFDDVFINDNYWGLISDDCQKVSITTAEHFAQNKSIYAKWSDAENCKLTAFGVSWNKWRPVDLSNDLNDLHFQLQIKNASTPSDALNLSIGMEDYDRRKTLVKITNDFIEGDIFDRNWITVTVPLSSLPEDFDFSRSKQMIFSMEGNGEVYIDDIRLIRTPGD